MCRVCIRQDHSNPVARFDQKPWLGGTSSVSSHPISVIERWTLDVERWTFASSE
jgi:hypothetical protein